jgi:hypothetical protein
MQTACWREIRARDAEKILRVAPEFAAFVWRSIQRLDCFDFLFDGEIIMRREFIEDAVLVLGGAAVTAGAWLVYWPLGLITAGVVCIAMARLAYNHRAQQHKHSENAQSVAREKPPEHFSAAVGRFHALSGRRGSN